MKVVDRLLAGRLWDGVACGDEGECWPWNRHLNGRGYGQIKYDGRNYAVHRLAYELSVGPIPSAMVVDHLCHEPAQCNEGFGCPHRRCCNPSHLAVVTSRENALRGNGRAAVNLGKRECIKGHQFAPDNTRYDRRGNRICLACQKHRIEQRRLQCA